MVILRTQIKRKGLQRKPTNPFAKAMVLWPYHFILYKPLLGPSPHTSPCTHVTRDTACHTRDTFKGSVSSLSGMLLSSCKGGGLRAAFQIVFPEPSGRLCIPNSRLPRDRGSHQLLIRLVYVSQWLHLKVGGILG